MITRLLEMEKLATKFFKMHNVDKNILIMFGNHPF